MDYTRKYLEYIFDSGPIEDTDANVLSEISKCLDELKGYQSRMVFLRHPLSVERGVRAFESDNTLARVFCRASIEMSEQVGPPSAEMTGLGKFPEAK